MKIIKIGAVWCPGCLVMRSIWKKINEKYNLNITEYDLDMDSDEVKKFNIGDKLPIIIITDDLDNEITRYIGEKSYDELDKIISNHISEGV